MHDDRSPAHFVTGDWMTTRDYVALDRDLRESLGLGIRPIAITFAKRPPGGIEAYRAAFPAPTSDGRTGAVPAGCVFWIEAIDRTFAISESVVVEPATPMTFRAENDRRFGRITSLTEPNGHTTRVRYDALGRAEWVIRPGDDDERPTQRFEYTLDAPLSRVRLEQRQRSGEDDVVLEIRHVDGLGRARGRFVRDDDVSTRRRRLEDFFRASAEALRERGALPPGATGIRLGLRAVDREKAEHHVGTYVFASRTFERAGESQ